MAPVLARHPRWAAPHVSRTLALGGLVCGAVGLVGRSSVAQDTPPATAPDAADAPAPVAEQATGEEWVSGPAAGDLLLGDRVQRGPDWKWGDQDGGVGQLGTVVKAPTASEWAKIEWDSGRTNTYRWGHEDRYDLVRRGGPPRAIVPAPARPGAGTTVPLQVQSLPDTPGSGDWDRAVKQILLQAFDADRSGALQTPAEVESIPCGVFEVLETEFSRNPDYSSSMRKVYGFPPSYGWVGASLGFSEAVRPPASTRWFLCTHPLPVGTRVRRGPDWKWAEQDGGSGGLGTVVTAPTTAVWPKVEWDAGGANTYRWGHEDAQDVAAVTGLDSVARAVAALAQPPGTAEWDAAVRGLLLGAYDSDDSGQIDAPSELHAVPCAVFAALEGAFARAEPFAGSPMRGVYGLPQSLQWVGGELGLAVQLRDAADLRWTECTSVPAKAGWETEKAVVLEAGTRVQRGPDWKWTDQDGGQGQLGTVIETPIDDVWIRVEWDAGRTNTYRWGHGGAYDLVRAGGASTQDLVSAIEATSWTGKAGGARAEILPLLVAAYDQDGSGTIDRAQEVAAMHCDVLQAVQARYVRGGHFSGAMRAVFGIEAGYGWVGGALGFSESVRGPLDRTMVACGLD